jgi:hypothetical protein
MKTIPYFQNDEQERAWRAGEIPADGPEPEPTIRGEIAIAIEMVAACDQTVRDIQFARIDSPRGLELLARWLGDAIGQLFFVSQLAENVEVRRG